MCNSCFPCFYFAYDCVHKRCPIDIISYICRKTYMKVMIIITSRELRNNQRKFLDIAQTEPVFVRRRNAKPIVIKAAEDADVPNYTPNAVTTAALDAALQGEDAGKLDLTDFKSFKKSIDEL